MTDWPHDRPRALPLRQRSEADGGGPPAGDRPAPRRGPAARNAADGGAGDGPDGGRRTPAASQPDDAASRGEGAARPATVRRARTPEAPKPVPVAPAKPGRDGPPRPSDHDEGGQDGQHAGTERDGASASETARGESEPGERTASRQGRPRPRRLALNAEPEPEWADRPPGDRDDRFSRRRAIRKAVRARRAALPPRGEDDAASPEDAPPPAGERPSREPAGRSRDGGPSRPAPDRAAPAREPPQQARRAPEGEAGPDAQPAAAPQSHTQDLAAAGAGLQADRAGGAGRGPAARPERARRLSEGAQAPPRPRGVVEADDTPEVVDGPIVSPDTVAGRGLTVVVAIMTFLCALLVGAVVLVDRAADAWGAEVMTQVSVTVLPRDGEPTARRLEEVAAILESTEGLSGVRIVPARQSEALLEPWLGTGVDLSLLPVPRLVIAERSGALDTAALAAALSAVPGASLDDHTGWSERLAGMASAAAGGAIAALGLMLAATVISIVFATRSTIATNAATVEVLHILGAEDRFVIRAFRRRFLLTGIRGAVVGLSAALALFGALDLWSAFFGTARASPQAQALFGDPSIGLWGYLALCLVAAGVAGLVALTSTLAVRHHLARLAP